MLVNGKKILQEAKANHYAIPACNYIDSDSARAFLKVAEKENRPLILAYAQKHQGILSLEEAASIGNYFAKKATVPVVLHLDHGEDIDFIAKAIQLGFNSVMIDASSESFEENIRLTREVVALSHAFDIPVEAELGHVGANDLVKDLGHTGSIYTAPESVTVFIDQTKVDSLAVSIGTAHGLYKRSPHISFEALSQICQVTDLPLVLHGGSSSGDENLKRCAEGGIAKINIYTDFVDAAFQALKEWPAFKDWIEVKKKGQSAMEAVLSHYYAVFGTPKYPRI